jgi:hypothetical protein
VRRSVGTPTHPAGTNGPDPTCRFSNLMTQHIEMRTTKCKLDALLTRHDTTMVARLRHISNMSSCISISCQLTIGTRRAEGSTEKKKTSTTPGRFLIPDSEGVVRGPCLFILASLVDYRQMNHVSPEERDFWKLSLAPRNDTLSAALR